MDKKAKLKFTMNSKGEVAMDFYGIHEDVTMMIVHAMRYNEELRQLLRHSVYCYNQYEKEEG